MEDLLNMSLEDAAIAAGVGLVGGFLAMLLVGGRKGKGGLLRYLIAGVIGSLLLPVVMSYFGYAGVPELLASVGLNIPDYAFVHRIVDSTVGATIVILIARVLA